MKIAVLTALLFFFTTHAHAWTINADFEDGIIGNKADGVNGFTGAFKYTKYTDTVTHAGKFAAELQIDEGSKGFGEWGGEFKYPKTMYDGDEVWIRVWAYFPTGFSFECGGCSQGIKYIRIHTASASGSNEGYHSILLKEGSVEIDSEVTGRTFHDNNKGKKTVGQKNSTGTWHAYEMYIKFSSQTGGGIYRVWQNGSLIFEDTATKTLNSSTSKSDFIYLFTYWNNGAPKTQKAYVDDIVVTNIRPNTSDSHGSPFIGIGDIKIEAPPLPPLVN